MVIEHREYGTYHIQESVLIDLINNEYMQRLKLIRQYGTRYYSIKKEEYNRFDHSIGVLALLRRYNAPLHEQIAGLLHDVSHTVFSHVGDRFFNSHNGNECYQDSIHEEFLRTSTLAQVLDKHDINVSDILHKNKQFRALERDLPELCADRLEYNLKGGCIEGILTVADIHILLDHLTFIKGEWVFLDVKYAELLAYNSLYLSEKIINSPEALVIDKWSSEALKRAVELGIISLNDIKYSTDEVVWNVMTASDDSLLQSYLRKIGSWQDYISLVADDDVSHDEIVAGKFRGINPFIMHNGSMKRLSEISERFCHDFFKVKTRMEHGWKIKFM